jgi:hypothetical protein
MSRGACLLLAVDIDTVWAVQISFTTGIATMGTMCAQVAGIVVSLLVAARQLMQATATVRCPLLV